MYHICSIVQRCLTLCNPMDGSPPGSSIHGIFPSENTGWAAISSSGGPSRPRDQTRVSHVSCIAGGFLITEHTPRKLSNAKSGIPFSRKPVDKTSTSPRKRTIPTLPGCCACCCSCPRVRLCLGQCTPKAASELRGNEQDE